MADVAEQLTDEELEQKGFDARTDELVPESPDNPLEHDEEPVIPPELEEQGEAAAVAEAETPAEEARAVEAFIGDLTAEQVLEKLGRIDSISDDVFEKVSAKVFGKFGEIGQQLKALQDREIRFDPEKLSKLKEVDEGVAEALKEDLAEAFQGYSFNREELSEALYEKLRGESHAEMQISLLAINRPDAAELSKSEDFGKWYYGVADQAVRDTFDKWDSGEELNAAAMVNAYQQFDSWKADQAKATSAKQDAIEKSVESTTRSTAPPARRPMTEDEAFAARAKELTK